MFTNLFPKLTIDKVSDIDMDFLNRHKIKGLILDIDNTLVPQFVKEADDAVVEWIKKMKASGIKLCILSNASQERVEKFNEKLNVIAVHRAYKPNVKSFLNAADLMGLKAEEVAVVGDQIFTDVVGGNKAKMTTILVTPIDKNEILFVKLKRYPEKIVLSHYKRKKNKWNNFIENKFYVYCPEIRICLYTL